MQAEHVKQWLAICGTMCAILFGTIAIADTVDAFGLKAMKSGIIQNTERSLMNENDIGQTTVRVDALQEDISIIRDDVGWIRNWLLHNP